MSMKVIWITENAHLFDKIRRITEQFPQFEIEIAPNLQALIGTMSSLETSGIAIDVRSAIKLTPSERMMLNDISRTLPVLKFRWGNQDDAPTGTINDIPSDQASLLKDFLELHCALQMPRGIRLAERTIRHLRIELDSGQQMVTGDLSLGGAFLITLDPRPETPQGELRFLDFPELGKVRIEIRWNRPFTHNPRLLPGWGVRFDSSNPSLRQSIRDLLERT
jgi:hypothetical protein